jgi:hypothetical protein
MLRYERRSHKPEELDFREFAMPRAKPKVVRGPLQKAPLRVRIMGRSL